MEKQQAAERYKEVHIELRKMLPLSQKALLDELKELYDTILDNNQAKDINEKGSL